MTTPEVWITATRSDRSGIGASRIGGTPDLPPGAAWPRHRWTRAEAAAWPEDARRELDDAIATGVVVVEGDHLALGLPFVAQLDLAALAPLQAVLPRRGHLWLFADQQTTLGEIAGYPYCASACLFAEDAALAPATPPPLPDTLPGFALAFAAGLAGEQPEPRHACLSRPDDGSIGSVPPDGFTALLRVDSDDRGDVLLNWGDAAWITFAIPDDALAARRFDEVRAFRWIG